MLLFVRKEECTKVTVQRGFKRASPECNGHGTLVEKGQEPEVN